MPSPAGTRLTCDTRARSDSAGRRARQIGRRAGPGEMPYMRDAGTHQVEADAAGIASAPRSWRRGRSAGWWPPERERLQHVARTTRSALSEWIVGLVGHGQVRAARRRAGGPATCSDGRAQAHGVVGGGAHSAHAGVDLQMHRVVAPTGAAAIACDLRIRSTRSVRGRRESRSPRSVGRLLAEHQDRAVEPGLAQRQALLHRARRTARLRPQTRGPRPPVPRRGRSRRP